MNLPVKTQWIDVAPGMAGFLALPPAGRGPGLVLFQEIFGVNEHIRGVAEQYAADGFVVLAPDLFWRRAPRVELGYAGADMERAFALMNGYAPAEAEADIAAAVAALRGRPECGARVGAIGYCMGGRMAWLAATAAPVDAAVAYYGGGIHGLLDRAPALRCPVQFHYAAKDAHIPVAAARSVDEAVGAKPHEWYLYDGVDHGFNCWARGSHDAAAAALARGRTLQFLARELFGAR